MIKTSTSRWSRPTTSALTLSAIGPLTAMRPCSALFLPTPGLLCAPTTSRSATPLLRLSQERTTLMAPSHLSTQRIVVTMWSASKAASAGLASAGTHRTVADPAATTVLSTSSGTNLSSKLTRSSLPISAGASSASMMTLATTAAATPPSVSSTGSTATALIRLWFSTQRPGRRI